jgi:uncharacterized membrane protein YsdA (DUF1294 family)
MLVAFCIAAAFVVVNATAFVLFMLDKHLARERMRRVPESTLLLVALIGGSAGAIAGQQYRRHKTRKEPFRAAFFCRGIARRIVGIWAHSLKRGDPLTPLL